MNNMSYGKDIMDFADLVDGKIPGETRKRKDIQEAITNFSVMVLVAKSLNAEELDAIKKIARFLFNNGKEKPSEELKKIFEEEFEDFETTIRSIKNKGICGIANQFKGEENEEK
jgi:isopenicillin N synthase-like dioxygenase